MAACDCFAARRNDFAAKANEHYGGKVCEPMADWREVLARKDIDGVVISTPDHWHVPLAYHAALAGKDMYVEKPLGVAMAWAWKLRDAAARKKVVFQYGTQQRSSGEFTRAVELVRNGYIGKIKHVDAWCSDLRSPGGYAEVFAERFQRHRARARAAGPRLRDVDRPGPDEAVHEDALHRVGRLPYL